MSYPVKAIANAILDIAREHDKVLSPLKLQKLIYIAHGWHLAIYDEPLVEDEFAEAWQYGPVFPSIYHEFKGYGSGAIEGNAMDLERDSSSRHTFRLKAPSINDDDERTRQFLETVWQKYGKFSGLALSDATHRENTPWSEVWSQSAGRRNADIDNDLIKGHYLELARKRNGKK